MNGPRGNGECIGGFRVVARKSLDNFDDALVGSVLLLGKVWTILMTRSPYIDNLFKLQALMPTSRARWLVSTAPIEMFFPGLWSPSIALSCNLFDCMTFH